MKRTLMLTSALAAGLTLSGCNEDGAIAAIEAMGFTQVQLTGMAFFGCDKNDSIFFSTRFDAISVNGRPVHGYACSGLFKGWTVRLG